MKHVNFYQSPDWKKWGLAGCLIVALGANLSFNPDSKTIARNDGIGSGVYVMASKNVDEIDLSKVDPNLKGLTLRIDYKADSKDQSVEATYMVKKTGDTQAGFCAVCINQMLPGTTKFSSAALDPDMKERMVVAGALADLGKLSKEETKKEEKAKVEKPKKEDTSIAATFDLDKYRCDKPEESTDTYEIADYKECLSDNLKDMRQACKDAVQDKYDKDRAAAGKDKQSSVKRDSVSCERLSRTYYNEEVRPALRMVKRVQLNSALQTYEQIYNNTYNQSLLSGGSQQQATELARTRARLAISQQFPNLIAGDINATDPWGRALPGSLASIHNQMYNATNDFQYINSFRTEYQNPMNDIMKALIGSGAAGQTSTIDVAALLRNAMNVDTSIPTIVGQPGQPRPSGSTGPVIFPGRGPIGGGIPRTGITGIPQQQQIIQQQSIPQQMQPQMRQGGAAPGPRIGL